MDHLLSTRQATVVALQEREIARTRYLMHEFFGPFFPRSIRRGNRLSFIPGTRARSQRSSRNFNLISMAYVFLQSEAYCYFPALSTTTNHQSSSSYSHRRCCLICLVCLRALLCSIIIYPFLYEGFHPSYYYHHQEKKNFFSGLIEHVLYILYTPLSPLQKFEGAGRGKFGPT